MNDKQRNAAFRKALTQQLQLQRSLTQRANDELIALLGKVTDSISVTLIKQPNDYQQWFLPQILSQVETILQGLQQQAARSLNTSLDSSANAGMLQLDNALRSAGVSIAGVAPMVDARMLANMKSFHVNRISDITKRAEGAIELELSKVLVGAQTSHDAQQAIRAIMSESPAHRITTIVRTSMASVYSKSAHDRYTQAASALPGLKKRWNKSGKRHPRLTHVLAHLQTKPINEPFLVGNIKMMQPHDPSAPASEVIRCGCAMHPHMDSWDVNAPATKTSPTL